MKKSLVLLSAFMLLAVFCSLGQDTVRYPYPCYMEWDMVSGMHLNPNMMEHRWGAVHLREVKATKTHARYFEVKNPTTIYGIAITLWGQDTAKRDFAVELYKVNSQWRTRLAATMRWHDSLPFRHVIYAADDCRHRPSPGDHFEDTIKSSEFYFDEPIVVEGGFAIGYATYGVDGERHPSRFDNMDSSGYIYLASQQLACDVYETRPGWTYIEDGIVILPTPFEWGGLFPITVPQCNPDTLSCGAVENCSATPIDERNVQFDWDTQPSQLGFQVSVGPQGIGPDDNQIYDVAQPPYIMTDDWDTTVLYAMYVRAECSRFCYPADTMVWGEWSEPVFFFGRQRQSEEGIDAATGKQLFSLSPNPARESVTVTVERPYGGQATVAVFDAAGHAVAKQTFDGSSCTIDTRQLPAGSYFVAVTTETGSATAKLVVD